MERKATNNLEQSNVKVEKWLYNIAKRKQLCINEARVGSKNIFSYQ